MSYFYSTSAAAPTPDLLWLKLNDGSGTAANADVGPDATLVGGAGEIDWSTTGGGTSLAVIDGDGGSVRTDSAVSPTGTTITVIIWLRMTSYVDPGLLFLTSQSGAPAFVSNGIWVFYQSAKLAVRLRGTTSGEMLKTFPAPATGSFVMLTVVADMAANNGGGNGDAWLYVDDTEITTDGITENAKVGTANIASGDIIVSAPGIGNIDDIQVYDRAFDASEVAAVFAAGRH
jgi:hypothetical protein